PPSSRATGSRKRASEPKSAGRRQKPAVALCEVLHRPRPRPRTIVRLQGIGLPLNEKPARRQMGCVMPISGIYRIQAFLGLIYVCAGSAKLLGADIMVEAFGVTALGQSLRIAVGVLEICGGLCLFIPRASIYAAVVLGCTILGLLGA